MTKIVFSITLAVLLASMGFTVWEFTFSKQSGLANGQTAVWSIADEKFFDELAKDCTPQEELVRKGYEWMVENIRYDYSCTFFCNYQYFNIEKTLDKKWESATAHLYGIITTDEVLNFSPGISLKKVSSLSL